MKKLLMAVMGTFAICLTGCNGVTQPGWDEEVEPIKKINELLEQQITYDCLMMKASGVYSFTPSSSDAVNTLVGVCKNTNIVEKNNVNPTSDDYYKEAKRLRNNMIDDAITLINGNYYLFSQRLYIGDSAVDAGLDGLSTAITTIQTGLPGASSIVSGTNALQIMGVSSSVLNNFHNLIEDNVFNKTNIKFLVNKMDANRANTYTRIIENKKKDVLEYSQRQAILDLVEYYNSGTLPDAIISLERLTVDNVKTAQENLQNARTAEDSSSHNAKLNARVYSILSSLQDTSTINLYYDKIQDDTQLKNASYVFWSTYPIPSSKRTSKGLIDFWSFIYKNSSSAQNYTQLDQLNKIIIGTD
jgi:hypothetical protein